MATKRVGFNSIKSNNTIIVYGSGNMYQNATELLKAYTYAQSLNPSYNNIITIVVHPGYYNFANYSHFTLNTSWINLTSLTGQPDVYIGDEYYYDSHEDGGGKINVTNENITVRGIVAWYFNFGEPGPFRVIDSGAMNTKVENCVGGVYSFGHSSGYMFVNYTEYINCVGGNESFGSYGYEGTNYGRYIGCKGGDASFNSNLNYGYVTDHGFYKNCEGGQYCFNYGSNVDITNTVEMYNCICEGYGFGNVNTYSVGYFVGCTLRGGVMPANWFGSVYSGGAIHCTDMMGGFSYGVGPGGSQVYY